MALTQAFPRMALLGRSIPKRTSGESQCGDLIVLLDGLNEAPVAAQTVVRWLQASLPWMRRNRVRLIVTSLPETWELVSGGVPNDELYFEGAAAARPDSAQAPAVPVTDFNEQEALNAAEMYSLDPALIDIPAFRHPLTLRMLRDGSSWKQSHSVYDLFRDYFRAVFARVRSTSESAHPEVFCWSSMIGIARSMRSRSTLWIDAPQYYGIFGSATSLANSFIASHLLVAGTDGLRFTFDELAFCLIASLPLSEVEQQLRSPSILEVASGDELFGDSLPLILSKLEKEGDQQQVARILAAIAQSEHDEFGFTSFRAHQIFLRSIRYLRDPAPYYEYIHQFVSACAAVSDPYLEDTHSLLPYCALPALAVEQRYELLRVVALRELDTGWREKDWEDLSYSEFWQDPHRTDFVTFTKYELDNNSQQFLEELFRWLQDTARLKAHDSHPEARLSEVASAVLFFCGKDLIATVTDRLAQDFEKDGYRSLLRLFAKKRHSEIAAAIERWNLSPTPQSDLAMVSCVSTLLERKDLQGDVVERLGGTTEEVLRRSNSAELIQMCLGVLLRVPSRVEGALARIEQIVKDPECIFDPYNLIAIENKYPSRAFTILQTLARNNRRRREDAYYVMSALVIPDDPTRIFGFCFTAFS